MSLPTLRTERLNLRPPDLNSDTDWFFNLRSNPEFMKYMGKPLMTTRQQAIDHLTNILDRAESDTGVQWIITLKETGQTIGYAGLWRVDRANQTGELGYGLDLQFSGNGYMAEALKECVKYGFQKLNLNRIEAWMDTKNTPSARQLERLGAQLEGTLRRSAVHNGELSDLWVYGLLRAEWDALRSL